MSAVLTSEFNNKLAECSKILRGSKKITITTHRNPDGDAIGSVLALYHYAKEIGIEAKIIIHSEVPYNYKFLSGSNEIIQYTAERDDEYILSSDAIFMVDLNDVERSNSPAQVLKKADCRKVIIDHHIDPKEFADTYLVDTESTSAGELIYRLMKYDKKFSLNKDISESIYAAIMTDTGSFRFPRTDGDTHRIIADLIDNGADPVYLYEHIYNIRPLKVVKLLGEAFAGMQLYCDNKLCVMKLKKEHYNRTNSTEEDVEDIVENSLTIDGVKVGILLSECISKDEVRISFRSKGGISVRDVALQFNGGGHFHAAGARINKTPIDEVEKIMIQKIEEIL